MFLLRDSENAIFVVACPNSLAAQATNKRENFEKVTIVGARDCVFPSFFSNRFHARDFDKEFWSHCARRPKRNLICVVREKVTRHILKEKTQIKATAFKSIQSLMILISNEPQEDPSLLEGSIIKP